MSVEDFNANVHSRIDPQFADEVANALRRIRKALNDIATGGVSSTYAPANAQYLLQVAHADLASAQSMGALATGLVKNTTTTGVQSIAAQGTDYYAPGGTDVAVADGGTGASTAADARTNLGAIGGSSGSTDNALIRADGTGGATVQSSGVVLDDSDNITLPTTSKLQLRDTGQWVSSPSASALQLRAASEIQYAANTSTFRNTSSSATIFQILPPASGTPVNYLVSRGSATTNPLLLTATGTDADISINMVPKGIGVLQSGGVNVALVSDKLSVFAATTSAELAGVISDETGSGALVFANTPTLVTPVLGAATGTSLQLSGLTASEILATDGSKNLVSLAVATYPSLTELSYVKGVTSAIQTQLNAKQPLDATLTELAAQTITEGCLIYGVAADDVAILAKGTAGQVLTMNAGATAPEWAASAGGTPTAITVAGETGDATCFPLFVTASAGDLGPKTHADLTFDSTTGIINLKTPVFTGLPTGTGVSPTESAASTLAARDSSANLASNAFVPGYSTTATAAGTTTIGVTENQTIFFTGVTTHTMRLPVTSTLVLGHYYDVVNNSTGIVTVQSSGTNTVLAMTPSSMARFTVIDTTVTTAAGWNAEYTGFPSITGTGSNVLATSPTITTPTIADFTNAAHDHLDADDGGVLSMPAVGVSNSSTVGQVLRVTGASTYAFGAVDLADTDAVTGVLPLANMETSGTVIARIIERSPPATTNATESYITDSSSPNMVLSVLNFNATTASYMDFKCEMSPKYAGGGITIKLVWASNPVTGAASNEVRWGAAFRRVEISSDNSTSAHSYSYNDVDGTASATVGHWMDDEITFTDGADMDSVAAGETFILRIRRDPTHANDDNTGDASLISVSIRET